MDEMSVRLTDCLVQDLTHSKKLLNKGLDVEKKECELTGVCP
jgi:hypothetical protein